MKSKLIVNPVSGGDDAPDYLQRINERLRAGGGLDIVLTVGAGDATRAAEVAARDGYDRLYIAGGDGTLNEVLNGVAGVAGALERVTFGIVPLGTGNDFAHAIGLPEDIEEALDILLEGRTIEVDVGILQERRFINVSAGGFIAEVSDAVNPQLKTVAGKLAYLIGGARVLFDFEPVGARVRAILEDGATVEREVTLQMFAVCNSRLVGGGKLIAPRALIDDGAFDVCLVEAMTTLEFLALLPRVPGGDHIEDERVKYFRAREIEMTFDRTIKVNTDGEVLEASHCLYRIEPRAARFLAGETSYLSKS